MYASSRFARFCSFFSSSSPFLYHGKAFRHGLSSDTNVSGLVPLWGVFLAVLDPTFHLRLFLVDSCLFRPVHPFKACIASSKDNPPSLTSKYYRRIDSFGGTDTPQYGLANEPLRTLAWCAAFPSPLTVICIKTTFATGLAAPLFATSRLGGAQYRTCCTHTHTCSARDPVLLATRCCCYCCPDYAEADNVRTRAAVARPICIMIVTRRRPL